MIGRVGTVLGKANVNIRRMDVGSVQSRPASHDPQQLHDTALMVISVDDRIPDWALHEIGEARDIFGVAQVKLFHDDGPGVLRSHEPILVTAREMKGRC